MMKRVDAFFGFFAGFFRNDAVESSTRLVGILSFIVGLMLACELIVQRRMGAAGSQHPITWTDIVVMAAVFTYGCVALGLRSPFTPETIAAMRNGGTLTVEKTETHKTETIAATSSEAAQS